LNSAIISNPATDSVLFGYVLRQQRARADVTIEELARRASLDIKRLRGIDRGLSEPDLVEVFSIADALDLQPSELIRQFEELSMTPGIIELS
jgi:transcriptional regulator with XRE-family HTH domain